MTNDDYDVLFSLSREALLAELGRVGFEAAPRDPVTRGLEIYRTIRRSLVVSICGNVDLRELATADDKRPEFAAALADLIAGLTQGVPAATLAVLLIKDGLPQLCREYWT